MTVSFMYNFQSLSNKFLTILWSLIFHVSLPYFSKKKQKEESKKISLS